MNPTRFSPFRTRSRRPDTLQPSEGLSRPSQSLFRCFLTATLRAYRTWCLKREAAQHMKSFFATSEALGISPYSDRQTPQNTARLQRVHAIKSELVKLNFSHTTHRP